MNGFWIMLGLWGLGLSIESAARRIARMLHGITITQNVTHKNEAP